MLLRLIALTGAVALVAAIGGGCDSAVAPTVACPTLPARDGDVEYFRITADFRRNGGNAFVNLTGRPSAAELTVLTEAGLEPPRCCGASTIMVFENFESIALVAGYIGPSRVRDVASVACVSRISSTAGKIVQW
jgi:hypothetical protein